MVIALFLLLILPFSAGFGAIVMNDPPATTIQGMDSRLNHPEGIAFSRSGDCIAVANYYGDTVTFYRRIGDNGTAYETTPCYMIQGAESQLSHPHDVSFSPDGNTLAVANSCGNTVTIYKKQPGQIFYDPIPIATIFGNHAGMTSIQAVKYAPGGKILAAADMREDIIALYHYEDDKYDSSPYQIIKNSPDILHIPDGLAFSSDGELLAVTSHGCHSVLIYQRLENSHLYSSEPVQIIRGEQTNFCFTHSLTFSPSDDYLIVSSPGGRKTLHFFKKISETFPRYANIPEKSLEIYNPETIHLQAHYPQEGGVKGIALSPNGNVLGLCVSDIGNIDRTILIYPVQITPEN